MTEVEWRVEMLRKLTLIAMRYGVEHLGYRMRKQHLEECKVKNEGCKYFRKEWQGRD